MSSSYRSNRLGLSHWDPYTMRRAGCLELYYCNMVEWFWCDSSLILTTNWFPSVLCPLCWGPGAHAPPLTHHYWFQLTKVERAVSAVSSELEAQVQDLREVCKTSAADRAAAAQRPSPDIQPPSPRSTIQLPTSGPVVIPGSLVTVMSRESSPQHTHVDRDNAASTS